MPTRFSFSLAVRNFFFLFFFLLLTNQRRGPSRAPVTSSAVNASPFSVAFASFFRAHSGKRSVTHSLVFTLSKVFACYACNDSGACSTPTNVKGNVMFCSKYQSIRREVTYFSFFYYIFPLRLSYAKLMSRVLARCVPSSVGKV